MKNSKKITIHYNKLRTFALIILAIPSILFLGTWIKPVFAILCVALLMLALYFSLKTEDKTIEVDRSSLLAIAFVVLLWVFLSGVGGFFTQKTDHALRNVLYRDIINYSWPVRYEEASDAGLVYYIGFWLFPSLFGKLFKLIGGFKIGWFAARMALYLWTSVYIYTSILLLCFKFESGRKRVISCILTVFILFSGMDIIGALGGNAVGVHIEWWAVIYQYSSMSTQLCWVFNQAVPVWLACSLLVNEKDERNYALIGLLILPSSPFPLVGMAVYMLFKAFVDLVKSIKEKEIAVFFRTIFSKVNLISIVGMLPVFAIYYVNNVSAANSAESSGGFIHSDVAEHPEAVLPIYVAFLILEFFMLLVLLIRKKYWVEIVYCAIFLSITPLIQVGFSSDFCMRASIPGLFIVMVMLMEYLIDIITKKKKIDKIFEAVKAAFIVIIFLIGIVTPLTEYRISIYKFIVTKGQCLTQYDQIETLPDLGIENETNFACTDASDKLFYKYLARNNK